MSVAALEAALAAAPDDPGVYAAYADALADAGDPRGEFHRLLAALDAGQVNRAAGDKALRKLWQAHRDAWVRPGQRVGFYRQFGDDPLARVARLAAGTAAELTASPVWWLLRGVRVERVVYGPGPGAGLLDPAPFFAALCRSRVRTLAVAGVAGLGDRLVAAVAHSGLLPRLTELHLPGCGVTDHGAGLLAAHPHTRRLHVLDLDGNALSRVGVDALAAVGVRVPPPAFPTG